MKKLWVKLSVLNYERCSHLHVLVSIFQKDLVPLQREFADCFCNKRHKTKTKLQKLASEKCSKSVQLPGREGFYPQLKRMKLKKCSTSQTNILTQSMPKKSTPKSKPHKKHQPMHHTKLGMYLPAATTGRKSDLYIPLFPLGKGICNNYVSCWWISSIQALLTFYMQTQRNATMYM